MNTSAKLSSDRSYHEHNRTLPFADRIGYVARTRVYELFLKVMSPSQTSQILDIGVTDDIDSLSANLLEQLYPYKECLTCAGITDGDGIEKAYAGAKYVRIEPDRPLPFSSGQFDIVYSNAVLEHVGSRQKQETFIREACRVGKKVFIAVPNRLFPVEVHTGIPILHMLPKPLFRSLIRNTRFEFFSREENLNYSSARELKSMYPATHPAKTVFSGIGVGAFRSNLVSYSL